jgi:hypothetical protein
MSIHERIRRLLELVEEASFYPGNKRTTGRPLDPLKRLDPKSMKLVLGNELFNVLVDKIESFFGEGHSMSRRGKVDLQRKVQSIASIAVDDFAGKLPNKRERYPGRIPRGIEVDIKKNR